MTKLIPRFIRLKDAPTYLGMDRNRFNREVRPYIAIIPIGTQGIAFDRLDLDDWAEQYKCRSGRLSGTNSRSMEPWDVQYRQVSLKEAKPGTFGSKSTDAAFEKALVQSYSLKRKAISRGEPRK